MFRKLLGNLPFNPSLIAQVSFYSQRMKREAIVRRAGLIFVALTMVVQFFAVISPPQSSLASSNNDLIIGGITSKENAITACLTNDRDYGSILGYYGITCGNIGQTSEVTLKSTDYNKQLFSMGHTQYGLEGETPVTINNDTLWLRYLWSWDGASPSTYRALSGTSDSGLQFFIMFNCGNLVFIGIPKQADKPSRGALDTVDCDFVRGWAFDESLFSAQIKVHIYIDDKPYQEIIANQSRPDVGAAYPKAGSNHGFSLATPATIKDSGQHTVSAYAIGINRGGNQNAINPVVGVLSVNLNCKKPTIAILAPPANIIPAPKPTSSPPPPSVTKSTPTTVAPTYVAPPQAPSQSPPPTYTSPPPPPATSPNTVTPPPPAPKPATPPPPAPNTVTSSPPPAPRTVTPPPATITTPPPPAIAKPVPSPVPIVASPQYIPPPPAFSPPPTPKPITPITDICPNKAGIQTNVTECDVCPNMRGIQLDTNDCKPCSAAQTEADQAACLEFHKTAKNITANIENANNTTAQAGDVIEYTLIVKNNGKVLLKYIVTDNFIDVLDYADISNMHGGKLDQNKNVVWPEADLAPGQSLQRLITVKIKNPIPSTPISSSDPGHFDLTMTNVYNDTVNIKLPPAVNKQIETAARVLPNTGPGTSLVLGFAMTSVIAYFFARTKLFATELDLVREEFSMSGGQ